MHATLRRLTVLALGAVALLGTGCGDDDEPSAPKDVAGTYALRTVNGQTVPMTVYEGNDLGYYYKAEVLSGEITLGADGTFADETEIRETVATDPPETHTAVTFGTWSRTGNTLTLADDDSGESYTLTVRSNGSLAQSGDIGGIDIDAVYVKQ